MSTLLKSYIHFADFISSTMGSNSEVAIYDLSVDGGYLFYISKTRFTGREIGNKLSSSLIETLKKYKENKKESSNIPYMSKIPVKTKEGRLLRSSSYFIEEGEDVVGIINIAVDITDMVISGNFINSMLTELTGGPERNLSAEIDILPDDFSSMEHHAYSIIDEVLLEIKTPPDALSADEKISIIGMLNQRGVFQLKGIIGYVAKRLYTSEKTIYRYLNNLRQ